MREIAAYCSYLASSPAIRLRWIRWLVCFFIDPSTIFEEFAPRSATQKTCPTEVVSAPSYDVTPSGPIVAASNE
jgi:hypothetical protein